MYTVGKVVVFDKFVAIFGKKNMVLLVQKFCVEFFMSEFVPGYLKTKKNPTATMLEREGGGGLGGGRLRPYWPGH